MSFTTKLAAAWAQNQSLLMVGLDPDTSRLPEPFLHRDPTDILNFCKGIVDATAPYVCGFKPQIAYFAAHSAEPQLEMLCDYILRNYPHLVLMLDAKRGDIGSTADQYAREAFERYQADAVTVNPYMGLDSIEPYFAWPDRGVIILCRTSNPGGSDLQFLKLESGQPLYLHVAELVAKKWNHHGQCGLVVGATFPEEIAQVRQVVGDLPLLIPGIGAQGGDINATVQAGRDANGTGMMINSSRAILYASSGADWQDAAARAAQATQQAINRARGL